MTMTWTVITFLLHCNYQLLIVLIKKVSIKKERGFSFTIMASTVFHFPPKFVIICLSLVWKRQKAQRWIGSRPSRKFNHWTYHWFRRSSQLTLQLRISGRAGNWIYFLKLRSDRGPKGRGSESLHHFSKIILVLSVRFLERTLSRAHAFSSARFLERTLSRAHAFLSARH